MTREEVIEVIKAYRDKLTHSVSNQIDGDIESFDMAIKALEQERTGHWEWVQYDYNPKFGNWHCSECRCVVVECVGKEEKGGIPLYKYCPQCGAKMVEPQESEG